MPRLKVASGRNAGKEYDFEGEAVLGSKEGETANWPACLEIIPECGP